MRNNSAVIDTTHGLIHFPHLTMQVKTASSETTTEPKLVITDEALTIPPTTTKTITAFIDHPSKWNTTGTVTPLEKFTETANLLISHSMSTINDKRIAVRVTNRMESPYLIKKPTQIAEFSVVSPEQSKHIKPVDMAILSMIPQGDPDLTAYLNELRRTNNRINPSSKTKHSGSQNLKILESLRITPQYRPESSRDYTNSRTKKNSIHKRAQNLETNFSKDLIGLIHWIP